MVRRGCKLKLYLKYFSMQLKSILEYRRTFIISCFGQTATSIFSLLAIMFLFNKFGNVNGYTFDEVLICFAISFLGFSIAECFFRAFDQFDKMISNGEFDRALVRPRNLILQILGIKMEFSKFGRCIISIAIAIWVISKNPSLWTTDKIVTLILMAVGTTIIYSALFVLKAGITFFTTQGLEITNIFTDGARDLTQYPLDIYHKWVKDFFTYILPLALVDYYPFLYIIGRTNNKMYIFFPIISTLFIIPCYIIWNIGIRKYKSTGS